MSGEAASCPACGSALSQTGWKGDLCPGCLMRLALQQSSNESEVSPEMETDNMPGRSDAPLAPGKVLGNRYGVRRLLGRGGMGEVWRAFDLKLRVDVALKALRQDLFRDQRRLEMLRQEVRAAREVVSPNVCRIFDLVEVEGHELVSMEYVDGATLLELLQDRGPLELGEAQDIASQFLAGLEAIHKVGLVHRDVKPENIMITRAGRVVVMDFGLARQQDSGAGTVAGTPAYMAPEQAAGLQLDARADVFSAGVVLAEMVSPEGIKSFESRQNLWECVHSEPAKLPESPWAPVIQKAVAREPKQRYNSAHTLIRALEDRTLRIDGAEDLHPYPGLASFTEQDADYFFGREAEVERLWRRLDRPHLLAVVGPSGSGKTSFIRAGLIPSAEEDWAIVRCTPGDAALASLRRALASEIGDDSQAVSELAAAESDATVSAYSRWRERHPHALLIVDQFEELLTLNPADEQTEVAQLLARLAIEADVFVLLSMRDDFLMGCRDHEPLAPIFEDLTALPSLSGGALRRAVVQPAAKCGYRFEDDELVEEMLSEVEGERGALPLLAFAMARLWDKRDRDNGVLTRQAYHDIGGVGGALARHAEETMDRIGSDRVPVVRELFRNLVTAEGTRAVREWGELLSVFDEPQQVTGEGVLRALIDARLLTSYEIHDEDREPARHVEIIHESLLANWPRLVRWQTQDLEGAQLREELRQSARTWDEHGRHDDRLWTGTAYREYQVWRERYQGGLTENEEAFANSMVSFANRRRRRRRLAVTAGVSVLLVILAVITGLWRRSVQETLRAEAAQLITLGRTALTVERTEALAYAIASLQRADTEAGRRLALTALWAGPPATVFPDGEDAVALQFSPDGQYLAVGYWNGRIRVFPRDGGPPANLRGLEDIGPIPMLSFSNDSRYLTGCAPFQLSDIHVWGVANQALVRKIALPEGHFGWGQFDPGRDSVLTVGVLPREMDVRTGPAERKVTGIFERWPLDGGEPVLLGRIEATQAPFPVVDFSRGLIATGRRDTLEIHRLDRLGVEPSRIVARHPDLFHLWSRVAFDPVHDRLALCDTGGNLMLWPIHGDGSQPIRSLKVPGAPADTRFSSDGSKLALAAWDAGGFMWDLGGPGGAEPLRFGRQGVSMNKATFSPDGGWLATSGGHFELALWPITDRYVRVLRGHNGVLSDVEFAPDGCRLFTQGGAGEVLAWPLCDEKGSEPEELFRADGLMGWGLEADPKGRFLIVSTNAGSRRIPLDGGESARVGDRDIRYYPQLGPEGRLLAADIHESTEAKRMAVLDLENGEKTRYEPPGEDAMVSSWDFDALGRILARRGDVLSRWDPRSGSSEVLFTNGSASAGTPDGRHILTRSGHALEILNLEDGTRTRTHPSHWDFAALDFNVERSLIVTLDSSGIVRVGALPESEPQLLIGAGRVGDVFISPDGKWIAGAGLDGAVYLWPVPDVGRPPLYTLPRAELIAKLIGLTNLRAVPDEEAPDGYRLEPDLSAYRGWETVPTW